MLLAGWRLLRAGRRKRQPHTLPPSLILLRILSACLQSQAHSMPRGRNGIWFFIYHSSLYRLCQSASPVDRRGGCLKNVVQALGSKPSSVGAGCDSPTRNAAVSPRSPTRSVATPPRVATLATPDTLLRWYQRLIAQKFDGSTQRRPLGRPRVAEEVEQLVLRMAEENPTLGLPSYPGRPGEPGASHR